MTSRCDDANDVPWTFQIPLHTFSCDQTRKLLKSDWPEAWLIKHQQHVFSWVTVCHLQYKLTIIYQPPFKSYKNGTCFRMFISRGEGWDLHGWCRSWGARSRGGAWINWVWRYIDMVTYCWWKKSCTSWGWLVYPIIYIVLYIPGGAGFLRPTVWYTLLPTERVGNNHRCFTKGAIF